MIRYTADTITDDALDELYATVASLTARVAELEKLRRMADVTVQPTAQS